MKRKKFCILVCLIFLISFIAISEITAIKSSNLNSFDGKTLYVGGVGPGNYTRIQDAIDNATNGDSVFVYNDSSPYYENLNIHKSINLIGEDKDSTVISGNGYGDVVKINANDVNISYFKIGNGLNGIRIHSNNNVIADNIINYNRGDGIYSRYKSNIFKNNIILYNYKGMVIDSSSDNKIIDNIIFKNYFIGMYIEDSNNIVISGNNISKNTYDIEDGGGVYIEDSFNIVLTGNNIIDNKDYGIYLWDSSSNTITGNHIAHHYGYWYGGGTHLYRSNYNIISSNNYSDNGCGISLESSKENTIKFNNISSNNGHGIYLESSSNNYVISNSFFNDSISISDDSYENQLSNNTVNGKLLVYLVNESDKIINGEAGQIILKKCYNITIQNLDLSNTYIGIELINTDNCLITNNRIRLSQWGIYLSESSNNSFIGNNISLNKWGGIYLYYSNNNTIRWNNISNSYEGIRIGASNWNIVSGNYLHSNIYRGIIFWSFSIYNTVKDNTISNNEYDGIYLADSHFNTITGNNINSNKEKGIQLRVSGRNIINSNNISNNKEGIDLYKSNNNNINKNNFFNNKRNAFYTICENKWNQNYWNRQRIFPKLIFGKIELGSKEVTGINIDWRPALKPYDI